MASAGDGPNPDVPGILARHGPCEGKGVRYAAPFLLLSLAACESLAHARARTPSRPPTPVFESVATPVRLDLPAEWAAEEPPPAPERGESRPEVSGRLTVSHAVGRPAHPVASPSHPVERPGHSMSLPSHAVGLPSHAIGRPGHSMGRPGHSVGRPGHAVGLPSHPVDIPAHAVSRPAHPVERPAHPVIRSGHPVVRSGAPVTRAAPAR